jgi:hypothetical protein
MRTHADEIDRVMAPLEQYHRAPYTSEIDQVRRAVAELVAQRDAARSALRGLIALRPQDDCEAAWAVARAAAGEGA